MQQNPVLTEKQCLEDSNIIQPFVTAFEYRIFSAYVKSLNTCIYVYILIVSELRYLLWRKYNKQCSILLAEVTSIINMTLHPFC